MNRVTLALLLAIVLVSGLAMVHFSLVNAQPTRAPLAHDVGPGTIHPTHTTTPTVPTPTPTPLVAGGQSPPHRFGGIAILEGESAPDGTQVTALANEAPLATATTSGGRYSIDVPQPTVEDPIVFLISGQTAVEKATWEQGGVTILNLSATTCTVPSSGDWVLAHSCRLFGNPTAAGNVIVEEAVILEITSSASLDIDFSNHHLRIKSGAKVVIKDGGKIH